MELIDETKCPRNTRKTRKFAQIVLKSIAQKLEPLGVYALLASDVTTLNETN